MKGSSEDESNSVNSISKSKSSKKKMKEQASVKETLSFVFQGNTRMKVLFFFGVIGAVGNGIVYPILAYVFSHSFSDVSGIGGGKGLGEVRELAYTFMVIGVYALAMATLQTGCFETLAHHATINLKLQWFSALLRQDAAFFDVHDIGGIASSVSPSANHYRRGLGRKFGEGIQFATTGIGGVAYALYSSWKVALVVLAATPITSFTAYMVMSLNQTKTKRADDAYSIAGSVAYSTVSGIKTVLSLNAIPTMLKKYNEATQKAREIATSILLKQGFFNGNLLGSFILLYAILSIFGSYLISQDIEDTGCDPSGGSSATPTCDNSGPDVFGAMLGVAFAGQGISQVGSFLEAFSAARVAANDALTAINRKPGAPEETIYHTPAEGSEIASESNKSNHSSVVGETDDLSKGKVKAILPKYLIDATSDEGKKPDDVQGRITFDNVRFHYPTRPGQQILNDFSIDIPAGKTIAFIGPSGGGKSTVVKMLERFYDPTAGTVSLDGTDLKDINVKHLRSMIGYVGQEPTLFATTIGKNIRYGNLSATREEVEEAARQANAHDFITSFTDGYDTQVGDKGAQLSGGQKQRIAIARVLVSRPKILLLDEATSALDNESELVVQEALDNVLAAEKKTTTVIIAHRLSTIRNADIIAVVIGGKIVETGTHDELMVASTGYYRGLVAKQKKAVDRAPSDMSSPYGSEQDLTGMDQSGVAEEKDTVLEFKDIAFSYPTRPKKRILEHFNLKIGQGETVALVGPRYANFASCYSLTSELHLTLSLMCHSTVAEGNQLLPPLLKDYMVCLLCIESRLAPINAHFCFPEDPLEGSLEYLGEDIKSLNVTWFRDQIGYVGQEPTLFDETIANNIAYGAPNSTRQEIEDAAHSANAYDFIMGFPEGFDTPVGERGTQLSGGQKQRIAIARALVKKPEVLLLDEATSALDNESEAIVQEALDNLMTLKSQTCIVIAHRLTTIRNADRIAFIADGRVKEIGSHEELMQKPLGRYKRLVESQDRNATALNLGIGSKNAEGTSEEEDEDEPDWEKEIEEAESSAFNLKRARQLAAPDIGYYLFGSVGMIMAGCVFPLWGIMLAEMISLLFRLTDKCDDSFLTSNGFATCQDYWNHKAHTLQDDSYYIALYWVLVGICSISGNMIAFYGFGHASERLNKRVRDEAFKSMVRQEVAYFDKRSVGKITSQLQEDAARLHTFTGEPVRAFLIAFMWQFALLALVCIPFVGFARSVKSKTTSGVDLGNNSEEGTNSPGGIIVETLLNISTVSAFTMETERFNDFQRALDTAEPNAAKDGVIAGFVTGLSVFVQQWINALQFWFGAWVLFNNLDHYEMRDFLISNFALLLSLFGLVAAFNDISDRKECEESVGRIFYLIDRKSSIDPLSEEGKKLQ
eukprot:scaffold4127_cov126-Cylindrotheca_fusiformis.AAC.3